VLFVVNLAEGASFSVNDLVEVVVSGTTGTGAGAGAGMGAVTAGEGGS
jgi:hypothetical protein